MAATDYAAPEGPLPPRKLCYVEVKITYHNGDILNQNLVVPPRTLSISRATGIDLGLSTASLGGANGKIEIRIASGHWRAPLVVGTRQVNNSSPPPTYSNLGPQTLTTTYVTYSAQTGTTWQDQFRIWRLTS